MCRLPPPLRIKVEDTGCKCAVCGCSAHKASCWRGMCRLCSNKQQLAWRPPRYNEACPVCGLVLTAAAPMALCLRCMLWGCYPHCIIGFCGLGLARGPCWEAREEPLGEPSWRHGRRVQPPEQRAAHPPAGAACQEEGAARPGGGQQRAAR